MPRSRPSISCLYQLSLVVKHSLMHFFDDQFEFEIQQVLPEARQVVCQLAALTQLL